jgi:anti-anti-sigma factor
MNRPRDGSNRGPLGLILELALRRLPNESRLVLRGEFDVAGEEIFLQAVDSLGDPDGVPLVLDLGDLDFIDSWGASLVLQERQRLEAAGWSVTVRIGDGQPRRVFTVLGLEPCLEPDRTVSPPADE